MSKKTKSIRAFIRENRDTLDALIRNRTNYKGSRNDKERHMWILNDVDLYRWAQSEGVRI
jgi:hypothetical protein